jgi:PKD repeat protein
MIAAPKDPIQVSTTIDTSADFTDPGVFDTHTALWEWGDDITLAGDVDETGGSGSVYGSHTYDTPGVYTVVLTVTDKDGDVGKSVFRYVVVYDPDGGFVTGSGWINSPEGAYVPDPSLTGKAHFGFVSRYKKGANVPIGQTLFRFRAADLYFESDIYDWLVIGGSRAQFKGTGTINGEGEYKFILTGIDSDINASDVFDVDRFRIKIWYEVDEIEYVVYDNALGDESDEAATEIGGGSIIIHKK